MYNTNTHPTGQQITLNLQMIDQNLILSIILSQAFISINLGQTIPKRNKQNNNSNIKNEKPPTDRTTTIILIKKGNNKNVLLPSIEKSFHSFL